MSLGTHEIDFLKETLHAQQELLRKLYNELEAEREFSATAADETLSMILRLQGEKAAMEMEASQYKRFAEEKMCHAEETLEVFQELIYQKEMLVASLEFQVQAYKFKLASLGTRDLASTNTLVRVNSLPTPLNCVLSRRTSTEGARTTAASPKTLMENGAEPSLRRMSSSQGEVNSYWEEIQILDERVKGFSGSKSADGFDASGSSSLTSPESAPLMHETSLDNFPKRLDFHEYPEKVIEIEKSADSQCSPSVQDIFEVPQCHKGVTTSQDPDNVDENFDSEMKSGSTRRKGGIKNPTNTDLDLEELNRRLKQLEVERFVTCSHETNLEARDEELKVLREMMEKVEALQSEIIMWRTKKPPPPEDRSFGCFTFKEVMLCFLP